MLGTIERGNICRLVEFINDSVLLLKDNPLALGAGNKFQELLEIVSNCPRKWIYFKPFEDIGGIVKSIDYYYGVDEIIPYLFDKVELNRWYIVQLDYCPEALSAIEDESRLDWSDCAFPRTQDLMAICLDAIYV